MRCNDPSTHLFSTSCSTLTIAMCKTTEVSGGNLQLELNSPPLGCEATEEPSATVADDTRSSDISTPARWRRGQLYVHTWLTPSRWSSSSELGATNTLLTWRRCHCSTIWCFALLHCSLTVQTLPYQILRYIFYSYFRGFSNSPNSACWFLSFLIKRHWQVPGTVQEC